MAGAAAVIKSHVRKCGTKGHRNPPTKRVTSEKASEQRVGGVAGMNFDNNAVRPSG